MHSQKVERSADPVTLVGAGLVDSLLSIYLARRGHPVRVFERRPDPRVATKLEGRSINLAISARGLNALRKLGLEEDALRHAIPMRGRMMHGTEGGLTYQAYGKDDSQHINSISRAWLNRMLLERASQTGKVTFEFDERLTEIDLEKGELSVTNEKTGRSRRVDAPVILGTDGSASAVREAILATSEGHSKPEALAHGYKELSIPPGPGGTYQMEKNALHIWPRGAYMLIALPNEDGSFTCTLFLPFEGSVSFQALDTPARARAFFEKEFPDALERMPALEHDFFANPTGGMVTVNTAPWHAKGRALILGDAAHAIVPFFGQGMNCGFEDCVALDALLSDGSGWQEVFERFENERKPNADAIADMAVENFVEMRDRTADPRFLLEKSVEKKLLNAFPDDFLSRYTLVSFSLAPYEYAYRVGEAAQSVVSELSHGISSADAVDLARAKVLIQERLEPLKRPQP